MSTVKLAAIALLSAAFLAQTSVAALAEESESDDDSTSFVAPTSRPHKPEPNERQEHGDKSHRPRGNDFQVAVPPMVITPDDDGGPEGSDDGKAFPAKAFKVSPPQAGTDAVATIPDANGKTQVIAPKTSAFDPNTNKPIELNSVKVTKKTPADVFLESAQVGIGAMAAGAAVLGITAAVRGSKSRRQNQTDFIYEVETKE